MTRAQQNILSLPIIIIILFGFMGQGISVAMVTYSEVSYIYQCAILTCEEPVFHALRFQMCAIIPS